MRFVLVAHAAGAFAVAGRRGRRSKAALEPSPGNALRTQQIANVQVRARHSMPLRSRCNRRNWIGIADHRVVDHIPAAMAVALAVGSAFPVMPETTLIAPGVEGPKFVPKKLSFST